MPDRILMLIDEAHMRHMMDEFREGMLREMRRQGQGYIVPFTIKPDWDDFGIDWGSSDD